MVCSFTLQRLFYLLYFEKGLFLGLVSFYGRQILYTLSGKKHRTYSHYWRWDSNKWFFLWYTFYHRLTPHSNNSSLHTSYSYRRGWRFKLHNWQTLCLSAETVQRRYGHGRRLCRIFFKYLFLGSTTLFKTTQIMLQLAGRLNWWFFNFLNSFTEKFCLSEIH